MRTLSPGFDCQAPSSVRALAATKAPHRPESGFWVPRDRRDRPSIDGARVGEAAAGRWIFGTTRRERFEGEHPFRDWPPVRDRETPFTSYAPSEYQLKPWPIEAQSGAWCPRFAGGNDSGFTVERVTGGSSSTLCCGQSSRRSLRADRRIASTVLRVTRRPLQECHGCMAGVFS
jgi:hypothetical protein